MNPRKNLRNTKHKKVLFPFLKKKLTQAFLPAGESLQAASPHRLWIGLVGIYMEDYPDPDDLDAAVTACLDDMRVLGMNSTDFFISGHSLGGEDGESLGQWGDIWGKDKR